VGKDLTIEQGYEAARLTAIAHLAVLKNELGSLNKVKRIVKVLGMVNCTEDFKDQPKVISDDGKQMWLLYSGNFAPDWNGEKMVENPPGSHYGMVFQKIQLMK